MGFSMSPPSSSAFVAPSIFFKYLAKAYPPFIWRYNALFPILPKSNEPLRNIGIVRQFSCPSIPIPTPALHRWSKTPCVVVKLPVIFLSLSPIRIPVAREFQYLNLGWLISPSSPWANTRPERIVARSNNRLIFIFNLQMTKQLQVLQVGVVVLKNPVFTNQH